MANSDIKVGSSGLNTRPSSAANRLRSVVEDANNSQLKREFFRKNALRGAFYSKTIALTEWKPTSFKLIVFISSTFTDTQLERNFLMDELYFELRKKGFAHNIQVILMDMRWGIQDEMTLDHKTWVECARGIDWCVANSTGIALLSLQGDKFGYTPLPKSILQVDLDAHLQHCPEDIQRVARDWYCLDDNALQKEYVLRNLTSLGDPEYWKAFDVLLPALRGLPFDTERHANLVVGKSVTEWEVRSALSSELDKYDALCWSYRKISGDINNKDYCDTECSDAYVKDSFSSLIEMMQEQFPESTKQTYDSALTLSDLLANDADENRNKIWYLEEFKDFTRSKLMASLESIIARQQLWLQNGEGLGIPGADLSEMFHHCAFGYRKCSTFVGRRELVDAGIALCEACPREQQQDITTPNQCFLGISACVIGVSGAGKTALMAELAHELYERRGGSQCVIIRFCGTSQGSKNARSLMLSLCAQIEYVFSLEQKGASFSKHPYETLVAYFQSLLHDHPLLLFIDSLDQLTDENQGRSQISFLKGVEPHPMTRIVVSCLPDNKEVNPESGASYMYLCETQLKKAGVPRVEVQMAKEAAADEALSIVDQLLEKQGRCLQETQRLVVREKISEEKEKTALYLTLACGVVSTWTSQVDAASNLKGGVISLIEDLFSTLEKEFGPTLVRIALAFLTFSVKGISDTEMEDLLSLSDEVLDSVFRYHTRRVRRLPSHVWLRLRGAMEGWITETEHGCFQWFHRQLKETAERKYSSEKAMAHDLMAQYFGNLVDERVCQDRQITRHEWTIQGGLFDDKSVVNVRRCSESTFHMLQCADLTEQLESELCDFAAICSKIRAGDSFQLIRDLAEALNKEERGAGVADNSTVSAEAQRRRNRFAHYLRWLRQDIHSLRTCCLPAFTFSASAQPHVSMVREDVYRFLKEARLDKVPYNFPTGVILGKSFSSFPPLQGTFEGHVKYVSSVSFSPDGLSIVSGSADKTVRVWDVPTGEEKAKLEGHSADVSSVSFSPDGLSIVSGSADKTVRVWDVSTGEEKAKLKGHVKYVRSVSFSPDGLSIVSGSNDRTVRVWDVSTGEEKAKLEGHLDIVSSVSFSPDGLSIVSGSWDRTVRVWDVSTGEEKAKLEGHSNVSSVSFSPDGLSIVSGSADETVRVWDVSTGEEKAKLEGHLDHVSSVSFSPDGLSIVSGSNDQTVRVWEVSTGEEKA